MYLTFDVSFDVSRTRDSRHLSVRHFYRYSWNRKTPLLFSRMSHITMIASIRIKFDSFSRISSIASFYFIMIVRERRKDERRYDKPRRLDGDLSENF